MSGQHLHTIDSVDDTFVCPHRRIKTHALGRRAADGLVAIIIGLIRCYQAAIRPHLIGTCKFCPTCSEYAIGALRGHGLLRGVLLSCRRLIRCHPFSRGGIDPVPPARTSSDERLR